MYISSMLVLLAAVVAVVVLVGTFVVHHNNALGFLGQVLLRVLGSVFMGIVAFFTMAMLVVQSILHGDSPEGVTAGCILVMLATGIGVPRGCVICRDIAMERNVARDAVSWSYRIAAALVFPFVLVANMAVSQIPMAIVMWSYWIAAVSVLPRALGVNLVVSQIPMTVSDGGDPTIVNFTIAGLMIYLFIFCLLMMTVIALYGGWAARQCRKRVGDAV